MVTHRLALRTRRATRPRSKQPVPCTARAQRATALDLLRELAFVLHATQTVRQAMHPTGADSPR
jgi:hypothetical protein